MLVLAAVLWSSSSAFMRLLDDPSALALNEPQLTPLQRAFFRSLFGGLFLFPLVRRADMRLRPSMGLMVICFGVMTDRFFGEGGRSLRYQLL